MYVRACGGMVYACTSIGTCTVAIAMPYSTTLNMRIDVAVFALAKPARLPATHQPAQLPAACIYACVADNPTASFLLSYCS